MKKTVERRREILSGDLSDQLLAERRAEGWTPVAVEWQRARPLAEGEELLVEVPYGLRVAEDGVHLTTCPDEQAAMALMLDLMVEDRTLSEVAERLAEKGFTSRGGLPFTQVEVFEMLPRLVEVAPEVFASGEWRELRSLEGAGKKPTAAR